MESPPEQGLAPQRTKDEQSSLEQDQEISRQRWQRHIKFKSPQQVAKEEQQKRNFWPLLGFVVIGSLVAAFVLSNVFCAGDVKLSMGFGLF